MASLQRSTSAPPSALPEPPIQHKDSTQRPGIRRSKKGSSSGEQGTQSPCVSGGRTHGIRAEDISRVQTLIERCVQLYMPMADIVTTLQQQARVEPSFTRLVAQKLEEQNAAFFEAYKLKLRVKEQIVSFNQLLDQQCSSMQRLHSDWMQAVANQPFGPPYPGAPSAFPQGDAAQAQPQLPSLQQGDPFAPPQMTLGDSAQQTAQATAAQPTLSLPSTALSPQQLSKPDQASLPVLGEDLLMSARGSHHPPGSGSGAQGPASSLHPDHAQQRPTADEDALNLLPAGPNTLTTPQDDLIDRMPGWDQSGAASHTGIDFFMSEQGWGDGLGESEGGGGQGGTGQRGAHGSSQGVLTGSMGGNAGQLAMVHDKRQDMDMSGGMEDALNGTHGQHGFSAPDSPLTHW